MRIKDIASPDDFANIAWLCALGARVCYTKKTLEELLQESKITQKKETKEFLLRLCSYKHFSVFSHAFTYKKLDKEKAIYLAAKYFKTYWNEATPDIIGFSLRHYLEDLTEEERDKAIEEILTLNKDSTISNIVDRDVNVTLVYISREYYGYAVFYLENISRVMTHQLVRHTFLNFSQRSQRYVLQFPKKKELPRQDMMIIPPTIKNNQQALDTFLKATKQSEDVYIDLVNMGIPAEDARFILPHGQKTNIVVSGPIPHIMDFISKRIEKGAQWEIRDTAIKMKKLLERN
ncbi:thymidylate synthase complementing protein ThyX [Hydrogenobaculum sp. Y04AAS1]|uniref:FAD-dependent thymidylate synthase n=1 Tax=Hydrogenobaculum sp. (strain Y04AAS1) TaxID=380749 RepID=UPI00015BC7A4|nr:thymidylate synthase complementing protein ThyX [Hydrogenobaculum sp. Y04AAS1]HCT66408.1 FAD-dependent thymidylate synthase [Hydrogenobaculum sp.]